MVDDEAWRIECGSRYAGRCSLRRSRTGGDGAGAAAWTAEGNRPNVGDDADADADCDEGEKGGANEKANETLRVDDDDDEAGGESSHGADADAVGVDAI